MRSSSPSALTYEVGDSHQTGTIGSYVSAPIGKPLDIRFSEGSAVTLTPRSRGRVAQTTSNGATLVLEDGRAHADIVHREHTQWQVLAGPYVVGVTGTSFDVAFNVATQTFELDMRAGSVKVTGPGLKSPIEIRDQQRLTLSTHNRGATSDAGIVNDDSPPVEDLGLNDAQTTQSASSAANCPASVAPPVPVAPKTRDLNRNAGGSAESRPAESDSYQKLSASGKHARIVELAEQQGIDSITANGSRSDLLALGNAARFVGKTQIAGKAFRAVRDRFGGSAEATAAAFFLGRLAENESPATAMGWYDAYMAEAPQGVWAADATGRRLVLINQQQGKEAALGPAREYLARFPTGPYAGFARKLLSL
jgi:TolA-binding protein